MSPAAIGAPTGRAPLPVTLVAGWVGSGKSTLVGRGVDRIVMTRREPVAEAAADRLAWTLHAANRRARLSVTADPDIDAQVLGERGFAPAGIEGDRRRLQPPRAPAGAPAQARVEVAGTLDRDAMSGWMDDVHHRRGTDLLRLHGVLAVQGEGARWIARGVRTTLDLDDGSAWSAAEPRYSRLWLAGRGIEADELRSSLQRCVATS